MEYFQKIVLRDKRECILRNGTEGDGKALLDVFIKTHQETDFLLSYPEENTHGSEAEADFLKNTRISDRNVEILAIVDGRVVASAGIEEIGSKFKVRHRADFGISVLKEFWGLGIGTALLEACKECAVKAKYKQIELQVVAENEKALSMYRKAGFVEYGRNAKGFNSKVSGYQEIVLMKLEL